MAQAVPATNTRIAAPAQLQIERYHGKVVIVDFWASWCKPCRQSIPWLNQMRAQYGERGLVVIGVNVDAQRDAAKRFLRETPVTFEVIFDSEGHLAEHFELKGMPSSFVFDRNGELAQSHLGFREADQVVYEAALQRLLADPVVH